MTGAIDHVAFHARLEPERLAAVDLASGRRWSFAALDRAVGACARVFAEEFGCTVGDRIAGLSKNRVEIVIAHLACARIGAIFTPLNWRLSPAEVDALIADAEPRRLLVGEAWDDLCARIAGAEPLDTPPMDADRPSLILYTSGTSGRPKGVLLSERSLGQTAINFGLLGQVDRGSVFLIDAPMFHVIGLVTSVRPALMTGAAILVSDGFQPAQTLARLADPGLGVTHYFCVPQMAAALRADPSFDPSGLSGLKALFTGGAPHPAEAIHAWLKDGVPVADGYGMSEAGTVFGMPLGRAAIAAKAGSVGVATPAVQTRIVDDRNFDLPPGAPGELLLRGENLFSGYWRRPQETADAFTPDGWFRTGDIAVRDAQGFHTLVDRRKDMFISGGENVYPAEIEAALSGHPDLLDCAVIGVPDARWGEVGVCIVVLASHANLDEARLLDHLGARLARYKLPRRFVRIDALPRTGSGKVLKHVLRAWLEDQSG